AVVAREGPRSEALAVLKDVLALRPVAGANVPALDGRKQEARGLIEVIETNAANAEALVAELTTAEHPLTRLLFAVRTHAELDPSAKTKLGTELAAALGPDLAFPVLLGQIELGEPHEQATESPASSP